MLSQMDESEFHARVDAILTAVEDALADSDVDADATGGILTLDCSAGGKIIVNRQTPNREIWVAARSGGFHFRFNGAAWIDTRGGEDLAARLARVIAEQSGESIAIALA